MFSAEKEVNLEKLVDVCRTEETGRKNERSLYARHANEISPHMAWKFLIGGLEDIGEEDQFNNMDKNPIRRGDKEGNQLQIVLTVDQITETVNAQTRI